MELEENVFESDQAEVGTFEEEMRKTIKANENAKTEMREEEKVYVDFALYCHCNGVEETPSTFTQWLKENGSTVSFWASKWIWEKKFGYTYAYSKDNKEWTIKDKDGKLVATKFARTFFVSYEQIKKALPDVESKWVVQNDKDDTDTRFIYDCKTFDELKAESFRRDANYTYAVHRWYNYVCSKTVEAIFQQFGAVPCPNVYDHDIDLFIDGKPFDIKVSTISPRYDGNKDLTSRQGKDEYIKWLCRNASAESRKHTKSRIFVICKTVKGKSQFFPIMDKVKAFMDYYKANAEKYKDENICELIYVDE